MYVLLCRSTNDAGASSTPVLASATESQQLTDNLPGAVVLDNNCAVQNQ